jgi:hypothetical protein
MRTIAIHPEREIAVHASQPVFIGESFFDNSGVEAAPSPLGSILSTSSLGMVNGQELKAIFSATETFSSVGVYNKMLLLAVVVFQSFVIHGSSPFEVLANLFLMSVAVAFADLESPLFIFLVVGLSGLASVLSLIGVVRLPSTLSVLRVLALVLLFISLDMFDVVLLPLRRFFIKFLSMFFSIASVCFDLLETANDRIFVGHFKIVEQFLHSVNKEMCLWHPLRELEFLVLPRSSLTRLTFNWAVSKSSLIDSNAETPTRAKVAVDRAERLSERTLKGDAIVRASRETNRERATEMIVPCLSFSY